MDYELWKMILEKGAPWAAAFLVFGAAFISSKVTRHGSKETNQLTLRKDTIADRDGLIETLTKRIDKLEARQTVSEVEIETLKGKNNELVDFGNTTSRILDDNGLGHLIPTPVPAGVHVYYRPPHLPPAALPPQPPAP